MIYINFNLREPESDSETPINIVIRYNRNKLVYSSKESIHPQKWNSSKQRTKKGLGAEAELNYKLDSFINTIKAVFRQYQNDNNNQTPTAKELKALLDKKLERTNGNENIKNTFFGYLDYYVNSFETRTFNGKSYSSSTKKKYKSISNLLKTFQTKYKRKIDFNIIDLDFYYDFNNYLTHDLKLSVNTIGRYHKFLKTILHAATEEGINTKKDYQSKRFKAVSEETDSIYLNDAELKTIIDLDLSNNKRLDRCRDLFLIGCFTGLRHSDYNNIKKENFTNGMIKIEMQKTKDFVWIPIHPHLRFILNKYEGLYQNSLPPPISNQKLNKYIKEFCQLIPSLSEYVSDNRTKGGMRVLKNVYKWKKVSTHTARRSFATNLFLDGIPAQSVMKITGHRTESSFMKYIKVTKEENAKILQLHWENKLTLNK